MQCVWSAIVEQWKLKISCGEQWYVNIEVSGSILIDAILIAEALLVAKAANKVVVLCWYLRIDQWLADADFDIGIARLLVDSIFAGVLGTKSRNDETLARVFSKFLLLVEDLGSSEGHGDSHSTKAWSKLNSWHWLR